MNDRLEQIKELIPSDVKSVLDIGAGEKYFKKLFQGYMSLDSKNADINQDLNINQKIKLRSGAVDLVILSQILEHLANPSELITESKRISKKYILVGLPNELTIDNRIRFIFGKPGKSGFLIYGHKHFFTIKTIEEFIETFFGKYKLKYFVFAVKGGRYLPLNLRKKLARILPSLFAKEVYYLIELK